MDNMIVTVVTVVGAVGIFGLVQWMRGAKYRKEQKRNQQNNTQVSPEEYMPEPEYIPEPEMPLPPEVPAPEVPYMPPSTFSYATGAMPARDPKIKHMGDSVVFNANDSETSDIDELE